MEERRIFDICELCHWEDDGQDDPNGDYSLTEARKNFKGHFIMYRDKRNIESQTKKIIESKKALMSMFIELEKFETDSLKYKELWRKIETYEKILMDITYESYG
ncbi:hypothetical protein J2S16_001834 [Cytobacillus kochii]|nr:hypothetical protein [Cytobacillus kochii]